MAPTRPDPVPRGEQEAVHLRRPRHPAGHSGWHQPVQPAAQPRLFFPEPFEFRPERWLGDEVTELLRRTFAPFAIGDRSCAGKAAAYLETSLAVARAMWYLKFETAPSVAGKVGGGRLGGDSLRARRDEFQLQDVIVAEHDGPNLILRLEGAFGKREMVTNGRSSFDNEGSMGGDSA